MKYYLIWHEDSGNYQTPDCIIPSSEGKYIAICIIMFYFPTNSYDIDIFLQMGTLI